MAQVPVSLVPSVAPSKQTTPYLRVPSNTQEAAGVGAFRAIQGMGTEIDRASNAVAAQALAMQGLENETWAKNADVDVMEKIGTAQSEYDQLEGQNATKALPGHIDRVKKIRQEALDAAPNPMAKKMLDSSISRRVAFSIVDSGHKAGTQAKAANKTSRTVRLKAAQDDFDPLRSGSDETSKDAVDSEVQHLGEEQGLDQKTIDRVKQNENSERLRKGIVKTATNQPEQVEALFERVKDSMLPGDREVAQAHVDRAVGNQLARKDAQEIFRSSGFDPAKGPGQEKAIMDKVERAAEKRQDNPTYGDSLRIRVQSQFNAAMNAYKDTQNGYKYQLGNYILGQDNNSKIVDIDGIVGPKAPPEIKAAYEGLEPSSKRAILKWVEGVSKAPQLTEARIRRYNELKGMINDPEKAQEFYDMGPDAIFKEGLTYGQTQSLLNAQSKIKTDLQGKLNSNVNRAMGQLTPMLLAAGIRKDKDNEKEYFAFRGALEDRINDYLGDKKVSQIPREEVEKLGAQLLRDQNAKNWFGSANRVFNPSDIPKDVRSMITKSYLDKGFPEPSEEQITRMYSTIMYKQLYEKKQQGQPSAPGKTDKPDLQGLGQ